MMMMIMRRRLTCCSRERQTSIDFDDQDRVMTYNGLESCILNSQSYDDESRTSRGDGFATDSLDDDYSSSSSSSKDALGSFTSKWLKAKRDEHGLDEWELSAESPKTVCIKEKPSYAIQFSDVEEMKDKFSKLLLGEDTTGGRNGLSTALALSNAISNLAALVFGELWKLEPLPEERRNKWRVEMEWLLSPTNYMVELVPAKQNGANGGMLEIMTPRARADIHMNLPALRKLDSMLIETLDSMVNTEFWYVEGGSRAEGRSNKCGAPESKRWWLPIPQVPEAGLSNSARKELLNQGRVVHQVLKAAKSINQNILLEMPVPTIISNALPKSGKASLNDELYKALTEESSSGEEMLNSLNLKSEHSALDAVNKLEAAMFSWKQRISEQSSGRSPVRTSWSSFIKDQISENEKIELLLDRAQVLLQQLKARYPNLPQTFLDATKVQYGKDIGHSILEGYSRVLGNLGFSILSRIGDILKEDAIKNPNSSMPTWCSPDANITQFFKTPVAGKRIRHTLSDRMKNVDGEHCESVSSSASDPGYSLNALSATSTPIATPSRRRLSCIGREACISMSPRNSP